MENNRLEAPLGELTSFISKGIPPKYAEDESENTIRVLNQKCNRDYLISYSESRLHDLSKKKIPEAKYIKPGDVLINSTGTGTAGRVAQMNEVPVPTTFDGHMILLRPSAAIDPLYYGYAIKSQQAFIETLAEGSTGQTEINRTRLQNEVIIKYPESLDDQRTIAGFFQRLDKKIDLCTRINEQLDLQAQTMFKMMFLAPEVKDSWDKGCFSDIIVSTLGGDWGKETAEGNYTQKVYCVRGADIPGATVPIYYENRTAKLKLNEATLKRIDDEYAQLAGDATEEVIEKSKADLSGLEALVGSNERMEMLADDIIAHYEDRQYVLTGKAMIVCMTRRIAIKLYQKLLEKRPDWKNKVKVVLTSSNQDPVEWHDIIGNKAYRDGLAIEFKDNNSEFKIAIVVDMWLTGFDVPSMATMYIDKPMKGHTLMQAIARVNRVFPDKEAGLIVDYIGMAAELKLALSQYTRRDQDKVPDLQAAYGVCMAKLEVMRDFFYGFSYKDFFGDSDMKRLKTIADGVEFALGFEEDEKKSFIIEATALSQAETLCRSLLDEQEKKEIEFFKCVKAGLCKVAGKGKVTANEVNARILKMLEQAIEQDGVVNIFEQSGQKNPEISILSEEYMEQVRRMKHKNIAAEMLRNLLEDNIKVFARTGVVKAQLFSEKMQGVLKRYNNRMITSAEVIEELLNLSKEMTDAYKAGEEKGLSVEELAFYDALVADPEVLRNMEEPVLVQMAHELTDLIRRSRTVDWDKKQSARHLWIQESSFTLIHYQKQMSQMMQKVFRLRGLLKTGRGSVESSFLPFFKCPS